MKNLKKVSWPACLLILTAVLLLSGKAQAASPVLTLTAANDGDSLQVTVQADSNASVILSYSKSTGGQFLSSLGKTNTSGAFSTTVSTAALSITPGSLVHVIVRSEERR